MMLYTITQPKNQYNEVFKKYQDEKETPAIHLPQSQYTKCTVHIRCRKPQAWTLGNSIHDHISLSLFHLSLV
jgi:hypothetical protein